MWSLLIFSHSLFARIVVRRWICASDRFFSRFTKSNRSPSAMCFRAPFFVLLSCLSIACFLFPSTATKPDELYLGFFCVIPFPHLTVVTKKTFPIVAARLRETTGSFLYAIIELRLVKKLFLFFCHSSKRVHHQRFLFFLLTSGRFLFFFRHHTKKDSVKARRKKKWMSFIYFIFYLFFGRKFCAKHLKEKPKL